MPNPTIHLIPAHGRICFSGGPERQGEFRAAPAYGAGRPRGQGAVSSSIPPSAMASRISALPPGFSWLRATCRPSIEEVAAYAQFIAVAEGHPDSAGDSGLQHEAELQLWIWRTESRLRSPQTKRRRADVQNAPAD